MSYLCINETFNVVIYILIAIISGVLPCFFDIEVAPASRLFTLFGILNEEYFCNFYKMTLRLVWE